MDRTLVSSSSLRSVGYDKVSLVLEIEFVDGGVYQYSDVPVQEYTSLMAARSLGGYFAKQIKTGGYPCRPISR